MTAMMTLTRPARRRPSATRLAAAGLASGVLVWTTAASAAVPSDGYADLVEKVSPAVVYISSTREATEMQAGDSGMPSDLPFPPGSPFEEFFKRFGEQMPQGHARPMTALGSGFIISADGYVVTNNHVVDDADSISVTLPDKTELDAEVVGTDPQTDLALLKVKADKSLPYVTWGNSDELRPGDVVLAVGNPFGLGGSVTAGIVSARGRNIHAGPYDDFIQTDAPINRGNSGGPMFNTHGEVVGVNTAIYAPSGGNIGIGFAIPANMVKSVVSQLKTNGSVERGWLGVQIQPVTDDIAEAVGLDRAQGALVASVLPDSPAAAAGMQQGDVIIGYNDIPVTEMHDLPRMVADTQAGDTAHVKVWRDDAARTVDVEIARLEPEQVASMQDSERSDNASDELGARLATVDDTLRARLNLDESVTGVAITSIDPDGRAARQGLQVGDVIEQVGSAHVENAAELNTALKKAEKQAVLLLVNRRGNQMFVGLNLVS